MKTDAAPPMSGRRRSVPGVPHSGGVGGNVGGTPHLDAARLRIVATGRIF
jgi:hypothetical protein